MMNLQYRGIRYQTVQPHVECTSEVIGRYRGVPMVYHQVKAGQVPAAHGLKYRGATVR